MSDPDGIVDARGLLCPWPVLRLARAARAFGEAGGRLRVLADDPAAEREIAQLCVERGWNFDRDGEAAYSVGIAPVVNPMFTSSS